MDKFGLAVELGATVYSIVQRDWAFTAFWATMAIGSIYVVYRESV